MNITNTDIIALHELLLPDEITAFVEFCKTISGGKLEKTADWLQIIREKTCRIDISLNEIQKALSKAQRIADESIEQGIGITTCFNEDFPEMLKNIKSHGRNAHPFVLYYKGNIKNVSEMEAIAMIGTRNPTDEGLKMGEYYGEYFAKQGFNIVSGLAMGCDSAAHKGALKAKGITTAFVAHGLDIVHPPQNEALAEKIIASNGAIVSEYPIGTPVSSFTLIQRDRLQAGLADAVILIQSDIKKGGSMHAINNAIENRKPVFAVKFDDERINNHQMSLGNVKLINEKKAKSLTPNNAEKVIEAIDENNM